MQQDCGWVCAEIQAVLAWGVNTIIDTLRGTVQYLFEEVTQPIARTPRIKGQNEWIAFAGAANEPWQTLWGEVYLKYIIPLSLGLLFLGTAYVALRSGAGAMRPSEYRQKRLLRRIPIAFFTIFFWWPIASFGTRFADSIAVVLVDSTTLIQTFNDLVVTGLSSLGGIIVTLLMLGFDAVLLFTAMFLVATRWLLIMLLTVSMPLIAVIWVFEEWPFKRFAGVARNVASLYPGLLIGGIAAAILIRFMFELQLATTPWPIANDLLKAIMISVILPFAALLPVLIAFGSNRMIQYTAVGAATSGVAAASTRTNRAARTTARAPRSAVTKTASGIKTVGKPVRKGGKAVKDVGKKGAKTGTQKAWEKTKAIADEKTGYRDFVRANRDVQKGVQYWRQRRRANQWRPDDGDGGED